MESTPTVQWAGGGERIFAEIVEALDLPATDHIMAAQETEEMVLVLYTPVHDPDPRRSEVFGAPLRRDADGVLQRQGESTRLGVSGDFLPEVSG